jgi:hypothetical protein
MNPATLPPHRALQNQCEALLAAIERNAWEEAEKIAAGLLPLVAADQDVPHATSERLEALVAAQQALERAKAHIIPAYHSLARLLRAWKRLPPETP